LALRVPAAAGRFHGLMVRDDGSLAAWGYNAAGQLGDGSCIDRSFPVPTTGLTGVRVAADAVAGGLNHTLVLKTDGTVWAWGNNDYGQLGTARRQAGSCRCVWPA
jgi:alpha-tubulin suppressor-like RCC1 family protein